MKATTRILLYGDSFILGTIGISLRLYSEFEVTKPDSTLQEPQELDVGKTDILLFDLETTLPEAVLPLLEINPTLQLIGISPDINLVKVWSVRELREVSMTDLFKVFKSEQKNSPVGSGSNAVSSNRSVVDKIRNERWAMKDINIQKRRKHE